MGKYAPLGTFLRRWKNKHDLDQLELTFADIERIIGALLPNSASKHDWWRNEASLERGHKQSRSWLEAGFEAHPLKGTERVRFRRRCSSLTQACEKVDVTSSGESTA
ncbi:DUF7662 domain-containing protein [Novosphingobium resinovorum]|uniref:DUF7662 domain-containing protein n=1 Tax=Novosphingobium resinovorum TaxID=158500 RepID=UPI003AF349B6